MSVRNPAIIVITLFVAAVLTSGFIYFEYPAPYHSDTWDHISISKQMKDTGGIEFSNPYQENPTIFPFSQNYEFGFNVLLAELSIFSGLEEIQLAAILPALFTFLLGLTVFVLTRYFLKSRIAGLITAMIVLSMRTNIALLGPQFLVPMALATALTPINLFLFLKALENKKFWPVLGLSFVFTTIVHPAFTIVLILVFGLYLLLSPSSLKKNLAVIAPAIVLLAVLMFAFSSFIGIEDGQGTNEIIASIMEKIVWEPMNENQPDFQIASFLGSFLFSASAIGIVAVLVLYFLSLGGKTFNGIEFDRKMKILPIFIIALLPSLLSHYSAKISFFSPFLRLFMTLNLVMLMLAGIGIFYLFQMVMKNNLVKDDRTIKRLVLVAIAVFLAFNVSWQPFTPDDGQKLSHTLELSDLGAFEWIEKNTEATEKIISLPWHSRMASYLSNRKVLSVSRAHLWLNPELEEEIVNFFNSDCESKKKFAESQGAEIVFSRNEFSCEGFNRVFASSNGSKAFVYTNN